MAFGLNQSKQIFTRLGLLETLEISKCLSSSNVPMLL